MLMPPITVIPLIGCPYPRYNGSGMSGWPELDVVFFGRSGYPHISIRRRLSLSRLPSRVALVLRAQGRRLLFPAHIDETVAH